MDILKAVVLGIVQGLTEWLPISSTAHLRIVPALLGWDDPGAAFTAVIQIGTLLAVLIYFSADLGRAFKGWIGSMNNRDVGTFDARLGWAILIGTVPVIICGVLFQRHIREDWRSLYIIAYSLIGMGLVLLLAEAAGSRTKNLEAITARGGLLIGLWQAIALIPGASRSGSTISGGLFYGFDRPSAARFSFLLSVPSVFAAGLKELYDERAVIFGQSLAPVLVATIVSFVVGYFTIAFLLKFLQTHSTLVFIVYRIGLGVLLLLMLYQGRLQPLAARAGLIKVVHFAPTLN